MLLRMRATASTYIKFGKDDARELASYHVTLVNTRRCSENQATFVFSALKKFVQYHMVEW